jgi:membrane-associated protease RseP (regulator of RpoE activity)
VSQFYRRFKDEILVGGDPGDAEQAKRGGLTPWITAAVLISLVVWLGSRNLWTLLFVVGLFISVFLHEMGHFVTARLTGMKVTQFFMGFGPRLWSFKRGEVEYGLRALPLGAFVRIIGMSNLDPVEPGEESRAYISKSYPRRMLVITAGSLMHAVIAIVLFFGVYASAGRFGESGSVRIVLPPASGSPAEQAGLREGDVVLAFDGAGVTTRQEFVGRITSSAIGSEVRLNVLRDGTPIVLRATLAANPSAEVAYLGVVSQSVDYVPQSVLDAARYSVVDTVATAYNSVRGVFVVLNPVNIMNSMTSDVADPTTRPSTVVGASQFGGEVGKQDGLKGVLLVLASLNVFVGMFNLFPLLPFDGGHAAIATYERLRSRKGRPYRADLAKMVPVATAVVAMLVFLLMAGLYLDITQPLG